MRRYIIAEQKPSSCVYKLAEMVKQATGQTVRKIETRTPRGVNSCDMANWAAFTDTNIWLGMGTMRDCVKYGIVRQRFPYADTFEVKEPEVE